jgi:hypothetical protein
MAVVRHKYRISITEILKYRYLGRNFHQVKKFINWKESESERKIKHFIVDAFLLFASTQDGWERRMRKKSTKMREKEGFSAHNLPHRQYHLHITSIRPLTPHNSQNTQRDQRQYAANTKSAHFPIGRSPKVHDLC